jgi:SAM-dependent methyltransferase
MMIQGDFTHLAEAYANRPAYAEPIVDQLVVAVRAHASSPIAVDVGAGTGKLTQMLAVHGLGGFAVEPNEAMRREGAKLGLPSFSWRSGTAEETGLDDGSVDLVTMASAFHWADAGRALAEFHRILRPGGLLVLLWNPRDLARDRLQADIEGDIAMIAPDIRRRSSGGAAYTDGLEDKLIADGLFRDLVFLEAPHVEEMSADRHLGAWRSVNDIRAQAGEEKFGKIIAAIERRLEGCDQVAVRYRTRAWFVRRA